MNRAQPRQFDLGAPNRRAGFTLIEMLVVIGIIVLLLSITVIVGQGVIAQSQRRQCEELMAALDSLVTEYEADYHSMPPFDQSLFDQPNGGTAGDVRPEVAVFLEQVRGLKGAERIISGLPTQYLRKRGEYYVEMYSKGQGGRVGRIQSDDDIRITLIDPWGIEILYVHPRDKNATVGASESGFAGYGTPANERPYFVSAGPDRTFYNEDEIDPTKDITRKDNIYSYEAVSRPEDE